MINCKDFLYGYHIYIATEEIQRRKHHKKRINKKWRKKYGVIELDYIPYGEVFVDELDRVLYMTKRTYETIKTNI